LILTQDRQEINCTSRGYLTNFRVELQVGSTSKLSLYFFADPGLTMRSLQKQIVDIRPNLFIR